MNLAVEARGSTHDACFLRHTNAFKEIIDGKVLPNKVMKLDEDYGGITPVKIGESAFPRFSWLLKTYRDNTNDKRDIFQCEIA